MMKPKRVVDKELLKWIRENCSCMLCGERPVDPHHVKTVKAGGDDVPSNILPACRRHHQTIHNKGLYYYSKMYPNLRLWLLAAGHEYKVEKWDALDANLRG